MRIAMFDTHRYDREAFDAANAAGRHDILFLEPRLTSATASLADGSPVVCSFVNDRLDDDAVQRLAAGGVKLIALRSAGFNHVDLAAVNREGLLVVRVPEYSPYAVAEHGVALILSLNRKIHRAFGRVREANFSLEGLVGFDMHGKTVGVIGTGKIGRVFARLMLGFGCRVLGVDAQAEAVPNVERCELDAALAHAHFVFVALPLTPATRHLVGWAELRRAPAGSMWINVGRGSVVDEAAVEQLLAAGHLGGYAADVFEFEDWALAGRPHEVPAGLRSHPRTLFTPHLGSAVVDVRRAIEHRAADNILAVLAGGRPGDAINQLP